MFCQYLKKYEEEYICLKLKLIVTEATCEGCKFNPTFTIDESVD